MSSRPTSTPKRQRDAAALDSDADDDDHSDASELASDDDDDDDYDYRDDRAGLAQSQDADGSGAADSSDDGEGNSDDGEGNSDDGDYGSLFGDEDDAGDEAAPAGILPEEKEAMRTIQEILLVPEQPHFFKELTRGLAPYVICDAALSEKQTVELLQDKSFHQDQLGDATRARICAQTLQSLAALQQRITLINAESHKIFCVLPKFRKSRVVATMITRVHNVVAGIFILQLSLDQIAAGAADAAGDEPLSSAALAGHAALIASLEDAPPAQTLSLICSIVIANAPHVRRERVLAHIKQQRTQQLYDKPPVVKGVTARTLRTGLFFVVLKLTVEGDAIAAGGGARKVRRGVRQVGPGGEAPGREQGGRPVRRSAALPAQAHGMRARPRTRSAPNFQSSTLLLPDVFFALAVLGTCAPRALAVQVLPRALVSPALKTCLCVFCRRFFANTALTEPVQASGADGRVQASIVATFHILLREPETQLRNFLNSLALPRAENGRPPAEQTLVVSHGIPVGTLLCVRFGNNQRYQRFGVERGGLRNAHDEFKKIAGYPRVLPWLLRLDRTSTWEDVQEMIPLHVLFAMGACRVEISLVLPGMAPHTRILPLHVLSLEPIRKELLRANASSAFEAAGKQELLRLKHANAALVLQRRQAAERAKVQRIADKTLSKAERKEKKQQAQPEPPAQKPLSRDEMGLQADCVGQAAYDAHLRQHSLGDVLVVREGGRVLAPCVWWWARAGVCRVY